MATDWTQARIQQLIDDATQESLTLEYKAADSLSKSDDRKKTEITKDVGAMANSAGGTIIYGVKEHNDPAKKHLPEKLDPIDLRQFSKEWLEQVIMNIRPRISDLIIHPVIVDTIPNGIAYVVEIPQSTTAHQSSDHRYYKRFNFMSVPMEDYEIRDVMARIQHPKIELKFEIEISERRKEHTDRISLPHEPKPMAYNVYTLKTRVHNAGSVYGQYINVFIMVPYGFLRQNEQYVTRSGELRSRLPNLKKTFTYNEDNRMSGNAAGYIPILPGTTHVWIDRDLNSRFEEIDWGTSQIRWSVYCDNAQPNKGEIAIRDIPIIDRRTESDDDDE